MARIPQTEIEQLKKDISVERLVEAAGIALTKSGKDRLGTCPFHEDGEPSLVVTPAKNLWHCFGCGIGGGPIDWVIKKNGVSFRHAVELLREGASPLVADWSIGAAPVKRSTVRALPAPVPLNADDQQLLNDTIAYYHTRLKESPEALAYLKARGLDHPDLIDTFKLGVADRTLGLRLPVKRRADGAALRSQLERIGLYRTSGHEHFNGSLVIPVFDAGSSISGNVVEVYGRKLRDDLRSGTPKHLYLPGPHAGVFNLAGLTGHKEIILCEALIDALTFWCAGFTNVTAAYGVEGFTDEMLETFKRLQVERVLIAFDADDAGHRAADKLAQRLMAEGIECLRVQFPKNMDANEYALRLKPAQQSLGLVLRQAMWIGRGAGTMSKAEAVAPSQKSADRAPKNVPQEEKISPVIPEPAALPLFPSVAAEASVETDLHLNDQGDLLLHYGDRHWRVRGWQKNLSPQQMRVNLQVRREGSGAGIDASAAAFHAAFHVDTLDLYAARSRAAYIKQAAIELNLPDETIKHDLGQVLLKLEMLQDQNLAVPAQANRKTPILSADEERAALALLRSPDLIERIVADMERCGVVGEANNLLAGYLAAVSRKLDTPLAILIQSSSAAGKSSLMDAVLAMVPPEERIQYSAMTGQSLFYLGETDVQHKILAIAEEEGVRQAGYALKLLQSDGELTMASTGKDETTGNLVTKQYRVKGPVMLMLTTTAIDIDEELMNRCLVLTVNESREQTRAIHARQRSKQTLAGLLATTDKTSLTTLHQNAQRLLQSVHVVNPYADRLTFLDDKTRMRRDHTKYLTLIRTIALLHQHQREVKTIEHQGQTLSYIEATQDDIALANRIAHDVLGRTLDELPPQTRRLLTLLQSWVEARCAALNQSRSTFRFTRKELRDAVRWGDTQLKLHLSRLADLEYLSVHRRGTTFEYELVYDGKGDGNAHLCGLIDVATLNNHHSLNDNYDNDRSGIREHRSGSGRPSVGGWSGVGRGEQTRDSQDPEADLPGPLPEMHVYSNGKDPVLPAFP